ncbi:MAG: cytochrome P460 family protein [Myxococcales bacterium]|nr:cytochrome P460 family protein [Myxococcales bacterium]
MAHTQRTSTERLTRLALIALLATAAGCASELDSNAYFPKTYTSDYAKIVKCEKSGAHGGKYVTTYVTKDAETPWKNKSYPFSEGTVFVKVGHSDSACSDISGYFAMKKLAAGSGGKAGDWDWQSLDADGQVTGSGQLGGCTGCHSGYKDNDFVGTLP